MSDDQEYYAGVDIGSAFIKAVLISQEQIIAYEMLSSGGHYKDAARKFLMKRYPARASFDIFPVSLSPVLAQEAPPFRQANYPIFPARPRAAGPVSFRPHCDRYRRPVYKSGPDNPPGQACRLPYQREMRHRLRQVFADHRPHPQINLRTSAPFP